MSQHIRIGYHLYDSKSFISISHVAVFSLFSLFQEWGASCPHVFLGAYRLEHDMSWTPIEEVEERSQQFALIDKILDTRKALLDKDSPTISSVLGEKS